MNTRGLLFLCVLSFSLTFFSCKDDPSSIGLTLLTDDKVEIKFVDSYQDSIPQYSSFFKSRLNLGADESLLLGKIRNLEASTLIRFAFNFGDSVRQDLLQNNIQVLEATVELVRNYKIGDDEVPFEFSVHKVNSDWTSAGFNEDSLQHLTYEASDISQEVELTDSILTFKITNELVLNWLKAQAEGNPSTNKGLFLKPGSTHDKALGFYALNLSLVSLPNLTVVVSKPGFYVDTVKFFVIEDISVVTGDVPVTVPENIVIQGGLATHSKLVFDLTSIPDDAVVISAELSLTRDTLETLTGDGVVQRLSAFFITDSTELKVDERRRIDLTLSDNLFRASFTAYVQEWQRFKQNKGVVLRVTNERSVLDTYVIKGSSAADPLLRPRLKITYSGKN